MEKSKKLSDKKITSFVNNINKHLFILFGLISITCISLDCYYKYWNKLPVKSKKQVVTVWSTPEEAIDLEDNTFVAEGNAKISVSGGILIAERTLKRTAT